MLMIRNTWTKAAPSKTSRCNPPMKRRIRLKQLKMSLLLQRWHIICHHFPRLFIQLFIIQITNTTLRLPSHNHKDRVIWLSLPIRLQTMASHIPRATKECQLHTSPRGLLLRPLHLTMKSLIPCGRPSHGHNHISLTMVLLPIPAVRSTLSTRAPFLHLGHPGMFPETTFNGFPKTNYSLSQT